MKTQILDTSRQNTIGTLSPFFDAQLDNFIQNGEFKSVEKLEILKNQIIDALSDYRKQAMPSSATVTIGMSGGVDSALTAALFKAAGWNVMGILMPIKQDIKETERGREACEALGIKSTEIDLTNLYNDTIFAESKIDPTILDGTDQHDDIRRGNIRARLRMITLYNMANLRRGVVASTDNFSELSAGFWTLHGDVGDLAPIQSLYKSWEVPMLAKMMGLPESIWRAKPTDGLGIGDGDEAQFGCSYLEWDIMLMTMLGDNVPESFIDDRAKEVYASLDNRMGLTWHKRKNPINFEPGVTAGRFYRLERFDLKYVPAVLKQGMR